MKNEMSWFSMFSNKKIILESVMRMLGLGGGLENLEVRVVDIDGFLEGNCPRAYPDIKYDQKI